MKFLKYVILFLASSIIIFAIVFGLSKMKDKESTAIPSTTQVITQKNSAFSLENAPKESLKGKITTMTGEIGWQGRTATEEAKLSSPITIQQGEKLESGEKSNLSLLISDACSVEFWENTEIEIIQTLPTNIVFSQTKGTGEYIKVGNYPVSIRVMNLLADVDGDVIISINPKKPYVTINTKSGKVTAAYNDSKLVSHEVALIKGQTFTFNYGTKRGVLK
jgi:hypothetical protein